MRAEAPWGVLCSSRKEENAIVLRFFRCRQNKFLLF